VGGRTAGGGGRAALVLLRQWSALLAGGSSPAICGAHAGAGRPAAACVVCAALMRAL